jgi:hypothetical protein
MYRTDIPVGEQIPEEEGCMVSTIFISCYKYNLCELLYGAYGRYRTPNTRMGLGD